ncbi:Tetratricopeptide-like helical domain superfamily [Sesbania bispinosa]|nr:Tetratricopeptide-like helical domain superfamily [Sesbania bispinosa]
MEDIKLDNWGYEVLSYGRERSVILEAVAHDKHCVLANTLAAHFASSSSYLDAARSHLEHATLYEKLVFDVISYLMSDDRDDDVAVELHSKLLKEFPRDLISLKRAQVLCFYMGRPDLSLSLVHQVLPQNKGENYIYGMLAFPLLELGQMKDAEEAAKRGFEINKQDSCYAMFFSMSAGLEKLLSSWKNVHHHGVLLHLLCNAPRQRVVEVYDNYIWKELDKTDTAVAEVYLNAVALLLRLCVRDELDVFGDRFNMLADCLTDQANWYIEWHLDVLTVWALAKTGKISKAEDLLKGLKDRISRMTTKKQEIMQRGMTLAEALYAYGRGDDRHGVELLGLDFDANDYKVIGASDEQVDVFNDVWYNMLLNSGEEMRAIEVIEKRMKNRDGTPFLWRLLERGYKLANRPEAKFANEQAKALESAYFN